NMSNCNRFFCCFFFSSRRRHTRFSRDWSSDVCSSDLLPVRRRARPVAGGAPAGAAQRGRGVPDSYHTVSRPGPISMGCANVPVSSHRGTTSRPRGARPMADAIPSVPRATDRPRPTFPASRLVAGQVAYRDREATESLASERVMVRFSGAGAGVAELSWGQAGLWDAMQRQRTWLPIGGVCPLPPGLTRADLTRQLRSLMSRYPTLRTRLRLDPDEPRQVVSATGEIALEIVDAPDDADPRQVADAVMCRFERTPYDVVDQWPVRVAVVRHRGAFTHQVVVMCHLVTDAAGALLLLADLKRLAAGPGTGEAEEDGIAHPLAQARWQRSPKGQRMNDAALRYCRRVLAEVPARRFPEPGYRPKPRYWRGRFVS